MGFSIQDGTITLQMQQKSNLKWNALHLFMIIFSIVYECEKLSYTIHVNY